jgi:hypothetical protein
LQDVASFRHRPVAIWLWVVSVKSLKRVRCPEQAAVSNSCPVIVPLASIAVFWLPPESRKCLKRLRWDRFESYSAHHLTFPSIAVSANLLPSLGQPSNISAIRCSKRSAPCPQIREITRIQKTRERTQNRSNGKTIRTRTRRRAIATLRATAKIAPSQLTRSPNRRRSASFRGPDIATACP